VWAAFIIKANPAGSPGLVDKGGCWLSPKIHYSKFSGLENANLAHPELLFLLHVGLCERKKQMLFFYCVNQEKSGFDLVNTNKW
jgi:hypothetical protein